MLNVQDLQLRNVFFTDYLHFQYRVFSSFNLLQPQLANFSIIYSYVKLKQRLVNWKSAACRMLWLWWRAEIDKDEKFETSAEEPLA